MGFRKLGMREISLGCSMKVLLLKIKGYLQCIRPGLRLVTPLTDSIATRRMFGVCSDMNWMILER